MDYLEVSTGVERKQLHTVTGHEWQLPECYLCASATYDEALRILAATRRLGISPMLETVVDMLNELDRPDAAYRIVQIAGTNGKTSTSRYTAAILAGEGLSVALYTSPELVSMTERMEIDGAPCRGSSRQEVMARLG